MPQSPMAPVIVRLSYHSSSVMLKLLLVAICVTSAFVASCGEEKAPFFRRDYNYVKKFNAFYKYHTSKQNFSDAAATCLAESGKMLVPINKEEVEEAYRQVSAPDKNIIWVGLHDMFSEGNFVTLDGVPIENVYSNWAPGEPNDNFNREDCVVLFRDGTYNDGTCDTKEHFICKRTAEGLTQNPSCETHDLGYFYAFETDECYKLHKTPMNWRNAFKTCKAEEASLAIINSEEEARLLVNELAKYPDISLKGNFDKGQVHVGFNDFVIQGTFYTTEGKLISETGYEKWAHGQPDNFEGTEHCGSMYRDGSLNDLNCDVKTLFFCEKTLSSRQAIALR